ncbi:restriction endonuclease [Comamonas piscis]|uniref:Restriction endonuclease n=1 Tax=Comamonas piscis TaxID=1562974 RepID=A0A7G5EK88_9BURK|nr:restriction endonuclease [Comamonas piscis]QMV74413.1 restriction endonuclease [Comamonas piscis]WSO32867.1 restriction endonuclease [Comamonas piscis]
MARRKKSSGFEDMLDLLAMLPWWICVALAAASYFFLHPWAVVPPTADIAGRPGDMMAAVVQKGLIYGLASIGQYLLPFMCLIAAAMSAWRRKQRKALVSTVAQAQDAAALDGISWREFELLVGEAYRLQGYRIIELGGNGPDGGVDLVLLKGSEKFLVQCKQWKAQSVGVAIVRELYGVMAARGATGGFVVTSGRYSNDAQAFARGRNITLVDGPQLFAMVQRARQSMLSPRTERAPATVTKPQAAVAAAPSAVAPSTAQPACPRCSAAMELRTARQGTHAGKSFWGCSTFPGCRGTLAAA